MPLKKKKKKLVMDQFTVVVVKAINLGRLMIIYFGNLEVRVDLLLVLLLLDSTTSRTISITTIINIDYYSILIL